jgi:hypothetical protein
MRYSASSAIGAFLISAISPRPELLDQDAARVCFGLRSGARGQEHRLLRSRHRSAADRRRVTPPLESCDGRVVPPLSSSHFIAALPVASGTQFRRGVRQSIPSSR